MNNIVKLQMNLISLDLFKSLGDYLPTSRIAIRIVTGTWCLMAVVLVYSFTGNFTAYLAIPKFLSIPNSFEELAAREDYQISVLSNSVLARDIMVKIKIKNKKQIKNNPLTCNLYGTL